MAADPPPQQTALGPAQIVIRTDRDTREAFKVACQHIPGGMQSALLLFVEATIAHAADRQVRHMDGQMCPLSAMIEQLVIATRAELSLAYKRSDR